MIDKLNVSLKDLKRDIKEALKANDEIRLVDLYCTFRQIFPKNIYAIERDKELNGLLADVKSALPFWYKVNKAKMKGGVL